MPVASELHSETRAALKPAGNRARVSEHNKNKESLKNKTSNKVIAEMPAPGARDDSSLDSGCSMDCSSPGVSVVETEKVAEDGGILGISHSVVPGPLKRCDRITSNSDPLYTSFHDEEWGAPVHDDTKLFELLVLSIALAEFTWPTILSKRHIFRKVFNNFNPSSISKSSEKEIALLISNDRMFLSEQKLRAIVENANHMLKVQQEFGSFANYLWRFVKHKPIRNGFRYGRQVPVKTPKAELMSRDLMSRGFRCVGPSVVYSFMQVAGLANDHLITCFRYQEGNNNLKPKTSEIEGIN